MAAIAATIFVLAGCGSSKHATPTSTAATTTSGPTTQTTTGPGALQGEAASAAAGDIPDNQVYVTLANRLAGYSMKYPEGWAQQGTKSPVTFRDKNNIVRVVVGPGAAASLASVRADMRALQHTVRSLQAQAPKQMTISGAPAIKVVYRTISAPNPVTNKRVTLTVDRYYLSHGGRRAVVDLGTPVGVDNVDAYRLMIESFRWR